LSLWHNVLVNKGWIAPDWTQELGGGGAPLSPEVAPQISGGRQQDRHVGVP
jgi:hypothetical protein